jgi:O-antigen/teichoic acid export membrane protein
MASKGQTRENPIAGRSQPRARVSERDVPHTNMGSTRDNATMPATAHAHDTRGDRSPRAPRVGNGVHFDTLRRLWNSENRRIVVTSSTLVGTQGITSLFGFIYWWVAAHTYSSATVGFASASISAMNFLGVLCVLGFGTLLMGELANHRGNELSLISASLFVTGGIACVVGLGVAFLLPLLSRDLAALAANIANALLFAFGVALTTVTAVLDRALIGLMRGGLQLSRNVMFSFAKLAALAVAGIVFADRFGLTIYLTWALGNLASLIFLGAIVVVKRVPISAFRPQFGLVRALGRDAIVHHGMNLALQLPDLVLPLVVAVILSTTVNAYFYTAWLIAGFFFMSVHSLCLVLYASSASDPSSVARKMRFTLALSFAGAVAAVLVVFIGGGWILGLFGDAYAEHSHVALLIITLSIFPLIVKDHYVMVSRVNRRIANAMTRIAIGACSEVVMGAIGAVIAGLEGLAAGWFLAVFVQAVLMARPVFEVAHLPLPALGRRRTDASSGHIASSVTQAALPSSMRRSGAAFAPSGSAATRRFPASSVRIGKAATATVCGIGLLLLLWRVSANDAKTVLSTYVTKDYSDIVGITAAVVLAALLVARELLFTAGGRMRHWGNLLSVAITPLLLFFVVIVVGRLRTLL